MASNRGLVYMGPNHVEVQSIDYPKLENPAGKKINHGVILKVVATNICGSDQHMLRGRTTAPSGIVLGHEIIGEVIELVPSMEAQPSSTSTISSTSTANPMCSPEIPVSSAEFIFGTAGRGIVEGDTNE